MFGHLEYYMGQNAAWSRLEYIWMTKGGYYPMNVSLLLPQGPGGPWAVPWCLATLWIETFISRRSILVLSHLHLPAPSQRSKLEQTMPNHTMVCSRTLWLSLLHSLHLFTKECNVINLSIFLSSFFFCFWEVWIYFPLNYCCWKFLWVHRLDRSGNCIIATLMIFAE